ncbi:molybdopterin-guanine dinucleotide biosynthesis protein MobA [Bacteroidia bacterium]|nr:molybdopterin-guanine dinucleotide biosynthesis protein MobA [Bacteroidia bacterium]GHT03084.1 molybdopterin-guanine dinucleotide biosynthesis protein MobA [Bacteroidia bacterium]
MFLEVSNAQYLKDYCIQLNFNNGVTKTVDLENELNGSVYEPLRQLDYFKKFQVKYNTIEWPNGADYAPEYLYGLGR